MMYTVIWYNSIGYPQIRRARNWDEACTIINNSWVHGGHIWDEKNVLLFNWIWIDPWTRDSKWERKVAY